MSLRSGALSTAGVLVMAVALSSCDAVDYSETYSIDEPVKRIVIEVDNGDLDLVSSFEPGVRVSRDVQGWKGSLELETRVVDDVLTITARCVGVFGCTVDSVIEVPADVALQVSLGSGDLRLVGHEGAADLAVGEGSVEGFELAPSELAVSVASGSVELELDRPAETLSVAVGQGDVRVLTPEGGYALDLETGHGTVSLEGVDPMGWGTGIDVVVASGDVLVAAR